MLVLKNISKSYRVGDSVTQALNGVSVSFRSNEFVAVLGPSGCGKTTLLNVIGGLDRYDSGELIIDGRSTKRYRDADWDNYRNHSIGFVFQSYNLIPHQTVLANVELALTLSGVGKAERRRRATEALEKVGIADQAGKKPNQLSGGQMQRVAIARALVNDPEILLADEPTGALDSGTSVQIMELLKEVASDRLVIMVTHNPELAQTYATRTVNLRDGEIVSDSDPYDAPEEAADGANKSEKKKKNKTSMSFFTALSLSLNNLLTKKARTVLTSFAGSIGIIGIALILSLKSGFEAYIVRLQEDTLSSYPIVIQNESMDISALVAELSDDAKEAEPHGLDKVYSRPVFGKLINSVLSGIRSNDMTSFRAYIESERELFERYTSDIKYGYGLTMNIYAESEKGDLIKVNPVDTIMNMYNSGSDSSFGLASNTNRSELWAELIDNRELLEQQYETVYGKWPENMHEAVLFVNKNNEISDLALCALGLLDQEEVARMMRSAVAGGKVSDETVKSFSYEDICAAEFTLIPTPMKYRLNEATGLWEDRGNDKTYLKWVAENHGEKIKIVGIMRPRENAVSSGTYTIGYTSDLTEYCLAVNNAADIVKQQTGAGKDEAASAKYGKEYRYRDIDVFTGVPFDYVGEQREITLEDVYAYIATLPEAQQKQAEEALRNMSEQEILAAFAGKIGGAEYTGATYESNLRLLGAEKAETPVSISIYANSFESKDAISKLIEDYNTACEAAGEPDKRITYTDYMGLLLDSVSTIINTISYVLIAFVSVSLIVSSIMIGVITYISVLERTKEIGILRSLGASRRDISRVFNAETLIVGFISGVMGILGTLLLNIPVNAIIKSLSKIDNMAQLPLLGALALVAVSMIMTFIAGLIPSGLAARRDPVVALRTE